MRQKRAKAYRKLMALYSMKFGFRQPYQVLVDSEMCKSATDLKLELVKQFGTVLQGETKPMITQCCIHELYLQGKLRQPAVDLAKTFERRKCNHREAIPGDECITSVVGPTNKHRYVIATQSQPLRAKLRGIPAVPIVHVNRTVMVLEPPSDVTIETKEAMEEKALHPTAPDLKLVGPSTMTEPLHKKKKGPKGPNPLSIKKKKTAEVSSKDNGKGKAKATGLSKQMPELAKAGQKRKHDEVEHMHPVPAQDPKSNLVTDDQPRPLKKRRRRKLAQVDAAESDS